MAELNDLRDYLAGQALTGILASIDKWPLDNRMASTGAIVAQQAYAIADCMLEERENSVPSKTRAEN